MYINYSSEDMFICFSIFCSLRILIRCLKSSNSCLCSFSSGGKISLFLFTIYSSKYSAWFEIQNIATGNDKYTIILKISILTPMSYSLTITHSGTSCSRICQNKGSEYARLCTYTVYLNQGKI